MSKLPPGQKERNLRAVVSISAGILALAALCLGLTQATASEPQEEPATHVVAIAASPTISPVDTVLVYDQSGSMEFDTLCYGCWEPISDTLYPGGELYPLHWSYITITSADHCAGWSDASGHDCGSYQYYNSSYEQNNCNWHHRTYSDRYYIVIEGEEYSRLSADYHTWGYTPYYTFWVIQHNGKSAYYRNGSIRGAYLSHHPYRNYQNGIGLGVACTWDDLTDGEYCRRGLPAGGPYAAPRADYNFYTPSGDDYYIWVRGQGGPSSSDRHLFWGIDRTPCGEENYFPVGADYDGASSGSWDWRCLGQVDDLVTGTHTLNLWAGGAGFDVDRIVIQTRDDGSCAYDSSPPDSPEAYPANNGRTDWACSSCDPRFAGFPGGQTSPTYRPDCNAGGRPDQREDHIYDDEQPMRNALEAAKYFVGQLNPQLDQIGYVRYSADAAIASELQCLERLGAGGCTAQVVSDTVIAELEDTRAGGNTNIAAGIKEGIEVLSASGGHYGRPGAARAMVLMTDGEANGYAGCDPACDDDPDLWPYDDESAKDCVVWYAQQARDNDVVIFTISLGWGADRELMQYVADLSGGYHRWAPTSDKLDEIFEELLMREADFTASPPGGAVPLTVTFSNTSTGTYVASLWNFGDGAASTEISPTHTYTAAGVYTVTLTVAGPGGVDALTRTSYIAVQQAPVQPDLAPSYKAVHPKWANYGERITYTIAISNGTGPLTNTIHLTDAIQDGLAYAPGTLTGTSGAITDTHAPTLHWAGVLSPTPAVTITYAATVVTTGTQTITNVAELLVAPGLWAGHTCSTEVYVNWKSIYLPLLLRGF